MPTPDKLNMKPEAHATKSRGFALVVTLSLMILLTVTAVGLLSLSAVSLRSSSQQEFQAQARANARMALMIAIGELQKQLGPDQRVNAPASQMSDSTGANMTAVAGKRHWTGAYDSWNSVTTEQRPSPRFRGWLVSGDPSVLTSKDAVKSAQGQDVTLWQGVLADGSDKVAVASNELKAGATSSAKGRIAWWVGDENSKALIKRDDSINQPGSTWSRPQAIASNAYHRNPKLSMLDKTSPQLDLLVSQRTLDLATSNAGVTRNLQPDFTTSSKGVLSDVANGGLKRDMNLFLDHPISKPVQTELPDNSPVAPGDATWEELWVYHNLWRALEPPATGLASMTGGNLANTLILQTPGGTGSSSTAGLANDPFSMYKLPVIARTQWLLSLWAQAKGTTPQTYDLFWVTDGIITLWNPGDVPVALHPDSYMSLKYWNIPYQLNLFSGANKIADVSFANASGSTHQKHNFTMAFGTAPSHWLRYGNPDPVVLMPGEVLIMSEGPTPGNPTPWVSTGSDNSNVTTLAMKAGWNYGRGYSSKITLSSGASITGSTPLRFTVVANNNSAFGTNLAQFQLFYGPDNRGPQTATNLYELMGGREIAPPAGTNATNHKDLFPDLAGNLPTADKMTGSGKYPFFIFSHQVKTEDTATSWSRAFNPRALLAKLTKLDGSELALSGHEISVQSLAGAQDSNMPQFSTFNDNRGLFGGSYKDLLRGQDTVVTQSIPREPPLSLAAFQHAITNGFTLRYNNGKAIRPYTTGSLPEMSRVIGNSYALPVIDPDKTIATTGTTYRDHSYQMNRMLWDSWFLSSIVQQQSPHHTPRRTAKVVFDDFVGGAKPLPNPAIKAWTRAPEEAKQALFDTSGNAKADAHELASSVLMMEGSFNVNSTSVEAWKAMLASMDKAFVPVSDNTNSPGSVTPAQANGIAVQNLLSAFGASGADSAGFDGSVLNSAVDKSQWRGYRNLSYPEIESLADAIVVEIRKRGPFLSLSDFINRRLGTDRKLALCGPLQAALDATVNQNIKNDASRVGQAPAGANYSFKEAAELPKSISTPAHVLQADILTPISSQLTVRSDTFRIRAYGDARDGSGKVVAKAWCEALVQRVPDYLDPGDPPHAVADTTGRSPSIPSLSSQANRDFGRQFRIESFRWLSNSEV